MMISDGKSDADIKAVINHYNKQKKLKTKNSSVNNVEVKEDLVQEDINVEQKVVSDNEVLAEIEAERLTEEEIAETELESDRQFESGTSELNLLQEDKESAEKAAEEYNKGKKRSRHDAQYLPSPTGGGGVYVWPDGYRETAFEYSMLNLDGEEIDLNSASTTEDLTTDQYTSSDAQATRDAVNQAKEVLKYQNEALPEDLKEPITQEKVKEKAKEILTQKNKDTKFVDKLTDNVDFELIGLDPDQKRKIKEARSLQEKNTKDIENNIAANKKAREKLLSIENSAKTLKDKHELKNAEKTLKAAQKAYEATPTEETRATYETAYDGYKATVDGINVEYEKLNSSYDDYLKAFNGTQDRHAKLVKTDKDLALYLDAYSRDNSLLWGKTTGKLAVTLGEMGVGFLELKDKLSLPVLIQQGMKQVKDEWGYDLGENGDTLEVGLTYFNNHVKPIFGGTTVEQRRKARAYLKQAREGMYKAPMFSEIQGLGDFGNYFADLAFNQAPNLALMYYTGGASLYAMGAVSAGQKFGEYEDMIHEDGIKISPLQMYTAATLTGVTEALSEKITLGQIQAFKGAMASSNSLRMGFSEFLTKRLLSATGIMATVTDAASEGISEMAAQLSSNYLDRQIGLDVDPLEGVSESFWSGAVMSAFLFKAPVAGRNLYRALEGKDANQKIGEKQARLKELGKLLNSDGLSLELRDDYQVEHQKITKEIHNIQKEEISKLDEMSSKEKRDLLNIARNKYKLRKQQDDIANSDLDPQVKQSEIARIDNEISKLDAKKNDIKAPYYLQETVDEITIQADAIGVATGKTAKVTQMNGEEIAESLLEEQARIRAEIEANEKYLGTEQDAVAKQNIEAYQNELIALEQADNQFGYISPQEDGGFEVIINKDKPMVGTAAHELMHAVLFKSLQQDPSVQDAMGDALIEHVATLGGNNSIIGRRMQAYGRWVKDKDGNTVFKRDPNFGEEAITVISEGIYDGTLEYNEGFINKLGGFVRRTLQDKLGRKVRFNTGRDIYNFIKDFDRSLKAGKINKGIIRTAAEGAKGRLVKGVKTGDRAKAYSKDAFQDSEVVDDLGLKQNTANIVKTNNEIESDIIVENIKDDKGNIKASTANQQKLVRNNLPRAFALARQAAGKANDLTLDEALKMNDVMEWYSEYSLKLAELARTYKAKMKNGARVPFGAYMNNLLPKKYAGILDKLKSKVETSSMSDEATFKKVNRVATLTTTLSNMEVEGKVVALNSIGQNAVQKQLIDIVKKDKSLAKLRKYKDVKSELVAHNKPKKKSDRKPTGRLYNGLEAVSNIFGVEAARIIQEKDLNTEQRKSAQDFILANTNEIIAMMPFGTTASGDATGVANTKLGVFYKKGARTKMSTTGTGKGLATQAKQNINPNKFRELVGLVKGGRINNTSVDGTIRAVIVQVAAIANNQAIRQVYGPDTLTLKDGKASKMFSKRYAEPKIQFSNDADLSRLVKVENGTWPSILKNFNQKAVNMKSEEGRADFQNWIYNTMSNYLPLSFYQHSGNWTGTTKAIKDKDGNTIGRAHKGNYLYRSTSELKEGIQVFIDGGAAWNAEANLTEQEKQDIANALKRVSQKPANLKDADFKASKLRGFELIWKQLDQMIEDNPANAPYIAALLSSSSAYQGHFMRTGSIFDFTNTLNEANVEEHTQAATDLAKFLFNRLMQRNLDMHLGPALNSYFQGSLPKRFDKLLKGPGFNYQSDAGEYSWPVFLGIKPAWIRYFNPNVNGNQGGIDPNVLVLANGNTIAKEFGIYVDGALTPEIIAKQQNLLFKVFDGQITQQEASKRINDFAKVKLKAQKDSKVFSKAMNNSRIVNESKGISVLDFDDTLATSKSLVISTSPDGTVRKLTAEQFAKEGADLLEEGWEHDFSEFNKVVDGEVASLFNKALKLQGKFGSENMFVLTARPQQSAQSIFDFLKANGLNIPLKNITGLGNSTPEAKALWIAKKVADGYNDFYFADDALQNVQAVKNMLNQFDVKSKVQQAKIKFSKDASGKFNDIIQETTGIESQKVFSEAQAKIRGAKSKYKSIIPPSAQDFAGLLYSFLGKGKKGEQDMAFFKKALIDPFARGINELNAARQASANDYENLLKQFPEVKKLLNKKIEGTDYTHDQAVRIYLWNKAGFEIPGLSKRDLNSVVDFVENNSKVQAFADTISLISKKENGYSAPGDYWLAENIKSDLLSDGSIGDARAEFLGEWQQNADLIFSPENLNKIEAIYGSNFREALEDILYRMKTGRNRPTGGGRLMNVYTNWVNNSVGAIMFFNMRSALLQTISATNYVNWSDNNPLKAAAAFANQPQFWKDFTYLFNSDYLKQRRSGNQRGINEAELSAAVAGAENKAKAAIAWLLKKGFLPTQIADSFAIASGGATFYRNRVKTYVKQGMSKADAEQKAFLDFQETTEVSQQSARPDMISQQQASPLGKLILAFQNTPMQYARIMNKASRDLVNGRGDIKTHISKIAYYGFVQSVIFGALQSALFASLGDEDEEKFDKKKERILNGMVDSVLSGIGYGGKAVSTMKNTLITFLDQRKRGFNADHTYTILQLLGFSPPIGSKLRKVYSSIQTDKFNKDVFKRRGFTLDNPIWSAVGNVIEGVTNVPLGRLSQKMLNIDNALDANNKWWQRVALVLGWNTWDLGIKDADIEGIKKEIKKEKKVEAKEKTRIKREEKKKEKEEENKAVIEENKKKSKKDGLCSAVSKGGRRCKKKAINGGMCTVHEKAEQNESGKKTQCKHVKSSGKRCGMKTSSKSGLCYYHD